MKKVLVLVAALGLISGLIWLGYINNNHTVKSLTFASVQNEVTSGAKLYDVRTADEYGTGHFAGATNWSLQDMQAGKLPNVAKDAKIFVYCRSGNRSGQATVLLKNAGYTNVTDLRGLASVEAIGGKLTTT